MAAYLVFQAVLGLFLDFAWISQPAGNPMLMPGVLLAINGSVIAPRLPVWRMLPVTARDIDRARWWHSVGAPIVLLGLLMAASVLMATALGVRHASWRDIGLSWGGQGAVCVLMALVWMAIPLARRKWGRWSGLIILPLLLLYFRIAVSERGDLRPSLEMASGLTVLVSGFRITGAVSFPQDVLDETVKPWVGQRLDVKGLGEAAAALTRLYQSRGHLLSYAYLPAQRVADVLAHASGKRTARSHIPSNLAKALLRTPGIERFVRWYREYYAA